MIYGVWYRVRIRYWISSVYRRLFVDINVIRFDVIIDGGDVIII